jgi:hypothetical protein
MLRLRAPEVSGRRPAEQPPRQARDGLELLHGGERRRLSATCVLRYLAASRSGRWLGPWLSVVGLCVFAEDEGARQRAPPALRPSASHTDIG